MAETPLALERWVCFHCTQEFADREAAEKHFGETAGEVARCLRDGLETAVEALDLHRLAGEWYVGPRTVGEAVAILAPAPQAGGIAPAPRTPHSEGSDMVPYPPDLPTVTGDEMRAYRERWGMSQQTFAAELCVAQPQVSRWEKRERDIPPYIAKLVECIDRERRRQP